MGLGAGDLGSGKCGVFRVQCSVLSVQIVHNYYYNRILSEVVSENPGTVSVILTLCL